MAIESDGGPVADARDGGVIDGGDASPGGNVAGDSGALDPAAVVGKRGRGRPRKSDGAGPIGGSAAPSGTGNERAKPAQGKASLDLDLLANQLQGMHLIAATLLKSPEIALSESEAKQLAKAVKNMMAQYSINVSPKAVAAAQLIATASAIYAPRAIVIAGRKRREKAAKGAMTTMQTPVPPQGHGMPGAFDAPPPPTGSMKFN